MSESIVRRSRAAPHFHKFLSLRVERPRQQCGHERFRRRPLIDGDSVQARGPLHQRVWLVVGAGCVVLPLLALVAGKLCPRRLRGHPQPRCGTRAGCVLAQAVAIGVPLGTAAAARLAVGIGSRGLAGQRRGGGRRGSAAAAVVRRGDRAPRASCAILLGLADVCGALGRRRVQFRFRFGSGRCRDWSWGGSWLTSSSRRCTDFCWSFVNSANLLNGLFKPI